MEEEMKKSKRIVREYRTSLNAKPEQVFPLLCPVREYDWIPQWQCTMIYSRSGAAELGCVFKTDFGDSYGTEIWVVSHYETDKKISFVRTGKIRTTRYEVTLSSENGGTSIQWRQEITGLTREGNNTVESYTDKEFRALMVPLNKMLAHYLQTGAPLTV
jgi:hypothetical protein